MEANESTAGQRTRRNRVLPNALLDVYPDLKDPKEQDAAAAITVRYLRTGEWRTNGYKLPKSTLTLLKLDCDRVISLGGVRAAAGAIGGSRSKRKQTESKEEANGKQTDGVASDAEQANATRWKGKGILGGKPPKTPNTPTSRGCAGARADEDGEPVPAAPVESAEAEAKRLGFGQYAPVAGELRELMGVVRAETMAATVFMAADGKGMSAEELLGWARHRQRQGWRTGQGGGVLITRANVASDIAIWAANQANFRRAGSADGARPTAAQQDGGAAEGKKPEKREWRFEKAEVDEDPYRYIWGLPDDALPQFAAWFCGESGNERAIGFYGRFAARNGHKALRVELDKFVGSVRSGEEPENRGAAFTAALKAAERSEP